MISITACVAQEWSSEAESWRSVRFRGPLNDLMMGYLRREMIFSAGTEFLNDWISLDPLRWPLPGPARRAFVGGCMMEPMHNIPARGGLNFDETPFLAIWEVTQSCDLACKHCRAAAQPIAHPDELTTAEGKALIDQIADDACADFCVYRRRSDETKRRIRADPLRGR